MMIMLLLHCNVHARTGAKAHKLVLTPSQYKHTAIKIASPKSHPLHMPQPLPNRRDVKPAYWYPPRNPCLCTQPLPQTLSIATSAALPKVQRVLLVHRRAFIRIKLMRWTWQRAKGLKPVKLRVTVLRCLVHWIILVPRARL